MGQQGQRFLTAIEKCGELGWDEIFSLLYSDYSAPTLLDVYSVQGNMAFSKWVTHYGSRSGFPYYKPTNLIDTAIRHLGTHWALGRALGNVTDTQWQNRYPNTHIYTWPLTLIAWHKNCNTILFIDWLLCQVRSISAIIMTRTSLQ